MKDPAIKLFGKTIPLPPKQRVSVSATPRKENCDRVSEEDDDGKVFDLSFLYMSSTNKSYPFPQKSKTEKG